jgi:hypothetical protein
VAASFQTAKKFLVNKSKEFLYRPRPTSQKRRAVQTIRLITDEGSMIFKNFRNVLSSDYSIILALFLLSTFYSVINLCFIHRLK